jgi:hypothetical protein
MGDGLIAAKIQAKCMMRSQILTHGSEKKRRNRHLRNIMNIVSFLEVQKLR